MNEKKSREPLILRGSMTTAMQVDLVLKIIFPERPTIDRPWRGLICPVITETGPQDQGAWGTRSPEMFISVGQRFPFW